MGDNSVKKEEPAAHVVEKVKAKQVDNEPVGVVSEQASLKNEVEKAKE